MKKRKKAELEPGKLPKLWPLLVTLFNERKDAFDSPEELREIVGQYWKQIHDPTKCPNCGRGMEIKIYKADLHAALFLLAMAREVRANLEKGMSFTEANKVHVPSLPVTNAVSKHITHCDYLNFVKQSKELKGTGYWFITTWGWKALRGDRVPAHAKYWAGNLIGRSEETITLSEMFRTHRELVAKAIELRKSVRSDHRDAFRDYDPREWAPYAGNAEGSLFD